jgi:hypothetical protein
MLVRGDSMNAATLAGRATPIVDGMHILCVDMADADLEVETGKIYSVSRTLDGGQTYENTSKKAMVYRDRYELLPESTNPVHEKFVVRRPAVPGTDPAKEIKVTGLVYGLYSSLEELP